MSHEIDLERLPLAELARRCAKETDLYLKHQDNDQRYCFELFRRAIHHRDESALEVILAQYQPMVTRWVNKWMDKHRDFQSVGDEAQDYVALAFERFWVSFTPEKFDKSSSLAAVLKYLQMCVYGAITDAWRKLRHIQIEKEIGEEERDSPDPKPLPEDSLQQAEFWQLIKEKAKDAKEFTVVYASFSLNLLPREILVEYPGMFSGVKEIYQCKANLLSRLERDDDIRNLLDDNG